MKVFILCVTILCIANVNGGLHSLKRFHDGPSDSDEEVNLMKSWRLHTEREIKNVIGNPDELNLRINQLPSDLFEILWSFCNGNDDDDITTGELHQCSVSLASTFTFLPRKEYSLNLLIVDFLDTFNKIESVNLRNGRINEKDFHLFFVILATVQAEVIIDIFDDNDDGMLSGAELTNWSEYWRVKIGNEGVEDFSNEVVEALMQIMLDNADDGEWDETMTVDELTNFILQQWAMRIQGQE